MDRRGFTLIELLVFAAIFAVVMVGFITILVTVVRVQSRQASSNEVETQGQALLQQLQYYIQSARLVNLTADTATTSLQLRMATSSVDPTSFTLSTGTVYIQQGVSGALTALTSNYVTVSSLSFTRHYNLNGSDTPFGTDSVSYSFTMAANASNTTRKYSQSFESSAALFVPVPKIALVQQTSTMNSGASSSNLTATFVTNNSLGDLLIAVVANTNVVPVTVNSDSAGNTWTQIASTTYGTFGTELTIFDALNSKNSSDTVTIGFGTQAFNPSFYLYEYRGAATSSSFDAKSTATSTASTTLSSGAASPTSSVELLFGALALTAAPATPPTAGTGFTIEASSSASKSYIEDQNLFITGSAASTWSISPAASYTAIIATFK